MRAIRSEHTRLFRKITVSQTWTLEGCEPIMTAIKENLFIPTVVEVILRADEDGNQEFHVMMQGPFVGAPGLIGTRSVAVTNDTSWPTWIPEGVMELVDQLIDLRDEFSRDETDPGDRIRNFWYDAERTDLNLVWKTEDAAWFWCPGCDAPHRVLLAPPEQAWSWNGSLTEPTFTPSVLVTGGFPMGATRCHSFVTFGHIQFLSDCTHSLAGQTVPLPEWTGFEK